MWNKIEAENKVLQELQVPRPHRRDEELRAKILSQLSPGALTWSMDLYSKTGPSRLQPYIKEVAAVSYPLNGTINAWSTSKTPSERIINLTPEFLAAMKLTSIAFQELLPQVLDILVPILAAEEKKVLPPSVVMGLLAQHAEEISDSVVQTPMVESIIQALADVRKSPASASQKLFDVQRDHDEKKIDFLYQSGVFFVVGHELGHHLLNHGINSSSADLAPGKSELGSWLRNIDSRIPTNLRRSHEKEHEADAMSVLLGGRIGVPGSMMVSSGAFISTLCFSIVGEMNAKDMAGGSSTHPSFIRRSNFLFELMFSAFDPVQDLKMHPGLGREADGHPGGYSLQIFLVCQVIANLISILEKELSEGIEGDTRQALTKQR